MAYDEEEWLQAKAAFAAESGAKVLGALTLTLTQTLTLTLTPTL